MTSTRTVSLQNSAPRAGVVKGISYTIGDDAPWSVPIIPDSDSTPPPRAIHLKALSNNNNNNKITKTNKHDKDNMQVQVPDHGPQTTRQNRLPIFNQVRNMLNKSTANTRSDEMPSEHMSDMAVKQSADPRVKPSRWDSVFNARPNSPSLKSLKSKKSQSNISVLRDPETTSMASGQSSPTSLYSSQSGSPTRAPSQVSVNAVSQLPRGVTAKNQFKRKPVQSPSIPATENSQNIPPPQNLLTVPDSKPRNRFSLSHAALSDFTRRQSSDSSATGGRPALMSHFSWTTIGTSAAPTPMEEIEDPFPTALPPMPSQQLERSQPTAQQPAQSILSRKRPVQRIENQEWAPSTPRQRAATGTSATSGASDDSTPRATPHARNFSINDETPKKPSRTTSGAATPTQSSSGKKALPLLPFMLSEQEASHVEQLLSQERNLVMQRRNIERAITDLEQVEFASPLEVSFATVRDAKRKLEQHRETLQEVKMEEMDVGIKIARARRREDFGEGEGSLWVRRVTG
jgi:hypothetical protein